MSTAPKSAQPDWTGAAFVSLTSLFLIVVTTPVTRGDTLSYSLAIAPVIESGPLSSAAASLWEFGHLVWRPVGLILTKLWAEDLEPSAWDTVRAIFHTLRWLNIIAGALAVGLWFLIARRVVASRLLAAGLAVGFGCAHGFLTYADSGSSYVVGVSMMSTAAWLSLEAAERSRLTLTVATIVGILCAAAALVWFPFVLCAPAAVLAAWFWKARSLRPKDLATRERLLFAAAASAAFLILFGAFIGVALSVQEIDTNEELSAWTGASSHGWTQNLNAVRLATGLPRSFFYLGRDGVYWKRFLRKDPYAPVSMARLLLGASLWKLAAYWLFLPLLVWACMRTIDGRRALLILACAALPLLYFAVFLFEPSSPERFLPAFPFLLLAAAAALREFPARKHPAAWGVAAFFVLVAASNLYHMSPWVSARRHAPVIARLEAIGPELRNGGVAATLMLSDPIYTYLVNFPDSPHHPQRHAIYDVVEVAATRVEVWRELFAVRVLSAWSNNEDVWVSKRLRSDKPAPEWYWTEGDDPRIQWTDLQPYFDEFEYDRDVGGDDGFLLLSRSPRNQALAASYAERVQHP